MIKCQGLFQALLRHCCGALPLTTENGLKGLLIQQNSAV